MTSCINASAARQWNRSPWYSFWCAMGYYCHIEPSPPAPQQWIYSKYARDGSCRASALHSSAVAVIVAAFAFPACPRGGAMFARSSVGDDRDRDREKTQWVLASISKRVIGGILESRSKILTGVVAFTPTCSF